MDTDTLLPVYVGLSIAVGLLGFIIVSLISYMLMPHLSMLESEFMQFMTGAGWLAIWITYITGYSLGAHLGWRYVEKRLNS